MQLTIFCNLNTVQDNSAKYFFITFKMRNYTFFSNMWGNRFQSLKMGYNFFPYNAVHGILMNKSPVIGYVSTLQVTMEPDIAYPRITLEKYKRSRHQLDGSNWFSAMSETLSMTVLISRERIQRRQPHQGSPTRVSYRRKVHDLWNSHDYRDMSARVLCY